MSAPEGGTSRAKGVGFPPPRSRESRSAKGCSGGAGGPGTPAPCGQRGRGSPRRGKLPAVPVPSASAARGENATADSQAATPQYVRVAVPAAGVGGRCRMPRTPRE